MFGQSRSSSPGFEMCRFGVMVELRAKVTNNVQREMWTGLRESRRWIWRNADGRFIKGFGFGFRVVRFLFSAILDDGCTLNDVLVG